MQRLTHSFLLLRFVAPVDLFTVDVTGRRGHFDLRGVLLHVELFSTAPQQHCVVCVSNVLFDVHV